jgi:hypothetical protein
VFLAVGGFVRFPTVRSRQERHPVEVVDEDDVAKPGLRARERTQARAA